MTIISKKYKLNEKETAFLKKLERLDTDNLHDVLYILEDDPDAPIDDLIEDHNLNRTVMYDATIWEELKFPHQYGGDYTGYSAIEELKEIIAKYEAKGMTHIESEELCFVEVHELNEHELFLLKGALEKYADWHRVDQAKYKSKVAREKIANAKATLAIKKKEIADLEKIIADG